MSETVKLNVEVQGTETQKRPGRPINPNSARQLELVRKAELREQGLIKRGRPVNPNSPRQLEMKRKQELRSQGLLKPGRPKVNKSEEVNIDVTVQ